MIDSAEQILAAMQKQIVEEYMTVETKLTSTFSWSLDDLASSTDGDLVGPLAETHSVKFSSVSTDTRTLQPGALYIAIKGDNFDGHKFIAEAVKQGAVAVLISEEVDSIVPGVMVDDTRIALGQFARWHRLQMPVKTLVAVTGSNGKTTIKTLLESLFSSAGNTLATEGNLNNDFGVPRTLLNLRPEHEYAVIEMGANHPLEISYLTALALPDIAMINNASGAHLEGFGSLQGVINTKGEIYQGLNQRLADHSGIAIVNTDSPGYEDWLASLAGLGVSNIVQFGVAEQADFRVSDCQVAEKGIGIRFKLNFNQQSYDVEMPVLGFHNAMNAAACVAIANAAGLTWQQIQPGLASFTGVSGRLQKTKIVTGWLVDDSYNANPESVKAGISALVSLPGEAVVCLGAMAEIGDESEQAHEEVALFAKAKGVQQLYVLGEGAKNMPNAFGENGYYFDNHQALAQAVAEQIQLAKCENKLLNILVKGSRSAKMELVSEELLKDGSIN